MDVGSVTTRSNSAAYASYTKAAGAKTGAEQQAEQTQKLGAAYDVNISDAAKSASAKSKGLTSDEIAALKSATEQSYSIMIDTMTKHNEKLQGWLDNGIGKLNFGGVTIDATRFAIPEVATTPEAAKAAISEGGEWSVNAVSDRIFGLAQALAGDDEGKLKEMQDAIEKGFKLAGVDFKKATGRDDMPQITKDTHAEITKRFDELFKKLAEKNKPAEDKAEEAQL